MPFVPHSFYVGLAFLSIFSVGNVLFFVPYDWEGNQAKGDDRRETKGWEGADIFVCSLCLFKMSSLVHHFFNVKGGVTERTAPSSSGGATETFANLHVAVVGCCHGELDKIYLACSDHEVSSGKRIDFVICAGDFQALRREEDLKCMAVPEKYRSLGDFVKYYQGEKRAPYLTLFVGGNHECSDWLAEESYGGFLAPNIYYLGHSGVVVVDGCITVAGISGIFKAHDYVRPYPNRPFHVSEASKRSAYHVRRIEVEKLKAFVRALRHMQQWGRKWGVQSVSPSATAANIANPAQKVSQDGGNDTTNSHITLPPVDIFVSHDWPTGVTKYGDEEQLLRYKPYFREDIRHGVLGNPHTVKLLQDIKPRYWIAAHLHCRFEATVPHENTSGKCTTAGTTSPVATQQKTKFLALDKPAKGKGFIDFIDVPGERGAVGRKSDVDRVVHHPLWLRVLRESHNYLSANDDSWSSETCNFLQSSEEEPISTEVSIPAHSTKQLLQSLGLPPSPIQQAQPQSTIAVVAGRGSGHHRPVTGSGHAKLDDKAGAPDANCSSVATRPADWNGARTEDGVDAGNDLPWVEDAVGDV